MPRYGLAVLGGTFDRLHVGHAALLATAFRLGRRVAIGVTTERFLAEHPKPDGGTLQNYPARVRAVRRWLAARYPGRRYTIRPLDDPFGGAVDPGVGVLVVSAETMRGGDRVNAERRRQGRGPVPVEVVPVVLADDLAPVASRRIRAGVIDRAGRRRAPIALGVAVERPGDWPVVRAAVRVALPSARVREVRRRVPAPSPAGRARFLARAALRGRELGLGVAAAPVGLVASLAAPRFLLGPVVVRGRTPSVLQGGLRRFLRPTRAQGL